MESLQRRMFHRWEVVRGWVPAVLFSLISLAIELFYFNYMVSRGLTDKTVNIPIGPWQLPLSIALFLSLGNVVLLVSLWMTVFENVAYVKAGPDRQVRRILYPLRMIRVAALVLAPFTIILFLPYVVVSQFFTAAANSLSSSIPQIVSFYSWAFSVSKIDPSQRFIISQLSASLGAIVIAAVQVWRVRGTRNLMLLLRKAR